MNPLAVCGAGAVLLGAVVWLSVKLGGRSARLEALRAEVILRAEEQKRVDKILDGVGRMPEPDVRRRLRKLAGKK